MLYYYNALRLHLYARNHLCYPKGRQWQDHSRPVLCGGAADKLGARVLVLDMDPQKTAESWYQSRESPTPKLAAVTAAELPTAIMGRPRAL